MKIIGNTQFSLAPKGFVFLTKIFQGQERPSVYREGMALKFFGDLVCDYLGEERIVRTY